MLNTFLLLFLLGLLAGCGNAAGGEESSAPVSQPEVQISSETGDTESEPTEEPATDEPENPEEPAADGTEAPEEQTELEESDNTAPTQTEETRMQNDKGALTPEDALEYMKNTENLVIVDVAAVRWYEQEHFEGAMNIPIEELDGEEEDALYMEIPADRPVLMHCRLGMIVPGAYARVKELRPDIPEICIPHRRVQEHLAHARHCQEYPKGVHSALRADT